MEGLYPARRVVFLQNRSPPPRIMQLEVFDEMQRHGRVQRGDGDESLVDLDSALSIFVYHVARF